MRKRSFSFAVVLLAAALPVSGGEPRPAPNWSTTATAWNSGDYQYDGAGNIFQIGDDSYTYDALGRLTYATAKSPASSDDFQRYEYDSYGNLKKVTTTSTGGTEFVEAFRINKNTNQLNGTDCIAPYDVCFTGEYDGAGRQTGIIPNENRYEWTPLGEMKGVHLSTRREQYIYDANGERIVKIDLDTGGRLFTLRNGANQVVREISYEPSTQWTWNRDYVYRGGQLIAGFVAGKAGAGPHLHYHLDHLGTPRLLTDAAGYKQSIHAYWPFGEEAPGNQRDTTERMKFTGHERDSSRDPNAIGHDLYYMHARFYSPAMGRFPSVDRVISKESLRRPQMWNRYSYVANNPVKFTDPDGNEIRLTGCIQDANSQACQDQTAIAREAFGKAWRHVNNNNGVLTLKEGVSPAMLGGAARALGFMAASKDGFNLITGAVAAAVAKDFGGARTIAGAHGGANIYIDTSRFPQTLGMANINAAEAYVHETGHAIAPYFASIRDINSRYAGSGEVSLRGDAFPVFLENAWRRQTLGVPSNDLRVFYKRAGDILYPGTKLEEIWP